MAIRRPTLRLIRELRGSVGDEADQATRQLTRAWVRAWDRLTRRWNSTLHDVATLAVGLGRWPRPWELARIAGLAEVLDASEQSLDTLATTTGTTVGAGAIAAVTVTAGLEPRIIATQLPSGEQQAAAVRFGERILPSALDVITARVQQQIVATTRPLSAEAAEAMRRELVRGVAVGDNPDMVARQMLARVEGRFTGGLTRAINISRTETLDAYRVASRYAHMANADVLAGWTWLADLGPSCCPSCWSLHGTTHPVDQAGPLDHPQGRCSRAPRVKSWRQLGINLREPDDLVPDARATFDALPADQRLAVMGPQRLALLDAGQVSWSQLATLRGSQGWRDSYVPTPVAALRQRASTPAA